MKGEVVQLNWKKLTAGLCIGMLAFGLMGCGSDKGGGGTHSTASDKKLVIGLDDNYPPVGFRDESGTLIGSDIDMAKEAAKRLGVEVEFRPIDWSSKEAELASGKIDVIWNGLTPTPEREKNILFSLPYQLSGQVVFVPKDSPIQTVADLTGKIVGTQEGSTAIDALAKNPELEKSFKELRKYPDFVSAFMDLKIGRLDAVLGDEIVGRYYMQKKPGEMRVLPDRFGEETDAVGMKLGNEKLKADIDKVLREMKADGTMKKISEKWFGQDISYNYEK